MWCSRLVVLCARSPKVARSCGESLQLGKAAVRALSTGDFRRSAADNGNGAGVEVLNKEKLFDGLMSNLEARLGSATGSASSSGMSQTQSGVASVAETTSDKVDLSDPNSSSWSRDLRQAYYDLEAELSREQGWVKKPFLVDASEPAGEHRLLTRCDREQTGYFFNYAFFVNGEQEKLRGVVEFGPYLEGPPSCVHGGASATLADAAMGSAVFHTGRRAVTANLSVDYKSLSLLNTPYAFEASVDREEGRKVFTSYQMSPLDRASVCVKSTALFIMARRREAEPAKEKEPKKAESADYVFAEKSSDPKL